LEPIQSITAAAAELKHDSIDDTTPKQSKGQIVILSKNNNNDEVVDSVKIAVRQ
jgi:hypothetical protein